MQSVLGADCAVTAVVGEERTTCNKRKHGALISRRLTATGRYDDIASARARARLRTLFSRKSIGRRNARAREFGRGNHLEEYYDVLSRLIVGRASKTESFLRRWKLRSVEIKVLRRSRIKRRGGGARGLTWSIEDTRSYAVLGAAQLRDASRCVTRN